MRITFLGATREVTGSCYLVQSEKTSLLVDCGLFQGCTFCETRNFVEFPFDPSTLKAVVLTHAHLDHTGRLPKLIKEGFKGKIYATAPTLELAQLVLQDAYHIMQEAFRREYRPLLYEEQDVLQVARRAQAIEYSQTTRIGDLMVRFRDAGHIFGSAFIEITDPQGKRAVFSGDLGNQHVPILRETSQLSAADVLVMESTYGNRVHEDESTREEKLRNVLIRTITQQGVLIVPAFAIERTQQLLYELNHLRNEQLIPPVDVYLDSPMAIGATEIIKKYPQYYDPEAKALSRKGDDLFDFDGLRICRTRDESKEINQAPFPKVIISGAGMMNGGRILHHLVRYLGNPKTTVLIIGYQAEGTLGRQLYRGDKQVDVLGEHIQVKAKVESIGAYSAHADQNILLKWISGAARLPKRIYCTHGDEAASIALATFLQRELKIETIIPRYADTITL